MPQFRLAGAFFSAALLTCGAGTGAAADSYGLIAGGFNNKSRTERVEVAKSLLAEVRQLSDLIPTPRPSDLSWVEEERAAIKKLETSDAKNTRSTHFYNSPEWQHVKLHDHMLRIEDALNCVLEPDVQLRPEVTCWVIAGFLLDDEYVFVDGLNILQRAGRLPKDSAVPTAAVRLSSIRLSYRMFSRGIQQYVVLPYLRGDLK